MLQALQDWWAGILGGTTLATVLGWIGLDTVKGVRRLEREKADRDELKAVAVSIDEMRKDTMTKLDSMTKDASAARGELYKRIEEDYRRIEQGFKEQEKFNREVARYMGNVNGRRDGG